MLNLNNKVKKQIHKFISLISLTGILVGALPVHSEAVFLKGTAYKNGISQKSVTIGMSEILMTNDPIRRVAITDPSVADIKVLSDTSVILRGKRIGKTSFIVWEGSDVNARPQRFDLTVKRDLADLTASLKSLDPSIYVDYILVQDNSIATNDPVENNGPYATSYARRPEEIGEPSPSLVIDQGAGFKEQTSYDNKAEIKEKLVLKGKVKNSSIIAKAMSIAMAYMGEEGTEIKVLTRNGGFWVEGLEDGFTHIKIGSSDGGGKQRSGLGAKAQFIANLQGNLGNGSILSSSTGQVVSMLEVEDQVQIAVKARFYEISKTKNKKVEQNWAFSEKGALSVSRNNPAITGGAGNLILDTIIGAGSGQVSALFNKTKLAAYIKALEEDGSAKVLAEPTIVVKDGEPGSFNVGGEVPITSSTQSNSGSTEQVEFVPYGTMLNILPSMTEKDSILLNVSALTRELDAANAIQGTAPAFLTRKVETQVEMDPSQSLVLAGLINSKSNQKLSKVPLIGDIPLVGTLFRSKNFDKEETELIIILTPELVRSTNFAHANKPLALESQVHDNNYYLVPDGSDFGRRTSTHIHAQPMTPPTNGAVDLRRPSTMNDVDNMYR